MEVKTNIKEKCTATWAYIEQRGSIIYFLKQNERYVDPKIAPDCPFLQLMYLNLLGRKASYWEALQTKDRFTGKRG